MEEKDRLLTGTQRGSLWVRLGIRLLGLLLAVLAILYLLPPFWDLFAPFVLAFLLAWMLNPVVRLIQTKVGLGRRLISLLLVLAVLFAIGWGMTAIVGNLIGEVTSLMDNWQGIWTEVQASLNDLEVLVSDTFHLHPDALWSHIDPMLDNLLLWVQTELSTHAGSWATTLGTVAMKLPTFGIAFIVFIMGSYFIMADYPSIRYRLSQSLSPKSNEFLQHLKDTVLTAFGGYIRAQLLLSLGVMIILLIGFTLLGEPYGVLMAIVFSIVDFIPIVGAGTFMVPWAVVDVVLGDYQHAALLMVIWGIICLFRRVAEPKAVGSQTGLSPILSLISIYVGMILGGVVGMILGPVFCLVVINLHQSGLFDGVIGDVRLALQDVGDLMKKR